MSHTIETRSTFEDRRLLSQYNLDSGDMARQLVRRGVDLGLRMMTIVDPAAATPSGRRALGVLKEALEDSYNVSIDLAVESNGKSAMRLPPCTQTYLHMRVFPTPTGQLGVTAMRRALSQGTVSPTEATNWLTDAMIESLRRNPGAVLSRPYDLLSRVYLTTADIEEAAIERLTDEIIKSGATVQVDEATRAPCPALVRRWEAQNIPFIYGSGAERPEMLGRREFAARLTPTGCRTRLDPYCVQGVRGAA